MTAGEAPTQAPGGESDRGLDPRLARHLPADLWRELTAAEPGRRTLLKAAAHLRSLRYLLSTYLPSHLAQELIRDPTPGRVGAEMLAGSLLFADVSGFTALSEKLARQGHEGAERLTEMINRYFDAMIEILAWSGGILLKFAGDALLIYFSEQNGGEAALWAVRAGLRMMNAMDPFSAIETPLGPVALRMKIGIASGRFAAVRAGSAGRMEYVVLGETVGRTMDAEGVAEAGQVVVDKSTAAALPESHTTAHTEGFYAVTPAAGLEIGSFEVSARIDRHKTTPLLIGREALIADFPRVLDQIGALGAYLPAALVERVVARAGERGLESEFRPVAVIFCNVTGLEALLAHWGADDEAGAPGRLARLLSDYYCAIQRVVSRHGGIVARVDPYKGSSKMLILFGAPVAHEDDPVRAVRAALGMNAELAALNRRWRRELAYDLPPGLEPPPLQQRVGITLGPTFAGQAGAATRREYTVMGDDVNLSARLMAAAAAGQILLSHPVREAVRDLVRLTPLSPIRVKGKSDSIPIYQVEGLAADRLQRRLDSRGPLLGRERERARCTELLRQALAGHGATLKLCGTAGIGKSHLTDVLAQEALAWGAAVHLNAVDAVGGGAPYTPWIALIERMADILPADASATRAKKLEGCLAQHNLGRRAVREPLFKLLNLELPSAPAARPDPAQAAKPAPPSIFGLLERRVDRRPTEGPSIWQFINERRRDASPGSWQRLEGMIAGREGERLFAAMDQLLEGLAAARPLLLIFEDAQWLDTASRALLERLSERLDLRQILIMVVERRDAGAASGGEGSAVALGPLDLEGTAALVSHLVGDLVPAADLRELTAAVHAHSEGVPLMIEEIAHWLRQTGQTSPDGLRAGLRGSSTLQELVLSRLDRLPHERRNAAKIASLVGGRFDAQDLLPLIPQTERTALDDSLADLEASHLTLRVEGDPKPNYGFRQTLVRELIYDTLSFARRRELHAQLAAHLEAEHGDDATRPVELLAYHHQAAGQWLPAARYLILAAGRARGRYAYPQAGELYDRALATLDKLAAGQETEARLCLQARAHEGLGDLVLLNGDYGAAETAYLDARSLLPVGDRAEGKLAQKLALALAALGAVEEAERCVREALAACPAGEELAAVATLAWLHWRAGSSEADRWLARARPLAAAGRDRWSAGVAALLADLAGEGETAQRAYLSLDRPAGAALAACYQGDRHLVRHEMDLALDQYRRAAEIWEQENDPLGLALVRYCTAKLQWYQDDIPAARRALSEAVELLEVCSAAAVAEREAVQEALAAIEAGEPGTWPTGCWQAYDDAFRISILFRE